MWIWHILLVDNVVSTYERVNGDFERDLINECIGGCRWSLMGSGASNEV